VESMYVRLKSAETLQTFPVWVYGNKDLARGSGLFVGPDGVAANHHFLLPKAVAGYHFNSGKNQVEIVARLVGDTSDIILGEFEVTLSESQAQALKEDMTGIYFDWGGDHKEYVGWIEDRPKDSALPEMTPKIMALLAEQMLAEKIDT